MKKTLAILLLTISTPVFADCINPEDFDATWECLNKQTQEVERRLSSTYKELLGKLDKDNKGSLVNAQRLWVKYKEADCASFAESIYMVDRMLSQAYGRQCANDHAIQREKELRERL